MFEFWPDFLPVSRTRGSKDQVRIWDAENRLSIFPDRLAWENGVKFFLDFWADFLPVGSTQVPKAHTLVRAAKNRLSIFYVRSNVRVGSNPDTSKTLLQFLFEARILSIIRLVMKQTTLTKMCGRVVKYIGYGSEGRRFDSQESHNFCSFYFVPTTHPAEWATSASPKGERELRTSA